MTDRYACFEDLFRNEPPSAYAINFQDLGSSTVVVAPHGGEIEPGTSEICRCIAGDELSWYAFEGRKRQQNGDLHITSSRFDEPHCLRLISEAKRVLTVHGEGSELDAVYVGGLDLESTDAVVSNLRAAGFRASKHVNARLQGLHKNNICNLGQLGKGIQLEVSKGLRRRLFRGLSRIERQDRTAHFYCLCTTVREALRIAPM